MIIVTEILMLLKSRFFVNKKEHFSKKQKRTEVSILVKEHTNYTMFNFY